jgi:STE24 endopeptidase
LGEWEGLVLLGWLGSGAAAFTRAGERFAVRVGCGFRTPTTTQARLLHAPWEIALRRAGLDTGALDLYVHRTGELNAYAVGGRSVAVTSGVLRECAARRLGEDHLSAVLLHELGHVADKTTRFALITMWLATPWRLAARLFVGLGLATVGRRQPTGLLAAVVIAVGQCAQQGQVAAAATLSALAVFAIVCPLTVAAVSRRSEYAADRFAAARGAAPQLASALRVMHGSRSARPVTWTRRALSRHPSIEHRLDALDATGSRLSREPCYSRGLRLAGGVSWDGERGTTIGSAPTTHQDQA